MTPHAIRMLTAALAVVACLAFSPNARAEWQLYHIVFADNDDDLDYQEVTPTVRTRISSLSFLSGRMARVPP